MLGTSCRGLSWSAPILSQPGSTNFGVCLIRRLSNQKSIASSRLRSRVSLTIEICDEVPALSRLPPRLYADIFTERGDFKRFPDCDRSRTQKRDLQLALTRCWSGGDSNSRSHPTKSLVFRRIGTDLFCNRKLAVEPRPLVDARSESGMKRDRWFEFPPLCQRGTANRRSRFSCTIQRQT